jgi:hypothetical protein
LAAFPISKKVKKGAFFSCVSNAFQGKKAAGENNFPLGMEIVIDDERQL